MAGGTPKRQRCRQLPMKFSESGLRLAVVILVAAPLAEPGLAGKLTDKEHTNIAEPRPAGVPSDAVLEAAGAVIGRIELDIRNIFDPNDPRENGGMYRLVDRLHRRSTPGAIRAQLLFKSGDRYDAQKLAETARICPCSSTSMTRTSFPFATPRARTTSRSLPRMFGP
jgi:hypothetical protein